MPTPTDSPWTRVYNDAKIAIPAMTDAVFKQVLFQVVKDFLGMTNLWVESVPINAEPNILTYEFTTTPGAPSRLLLLWDTTREDPDRKWVQSNVMMQTPGVITISYSPSTAAAWQAEVAKVPTDPVVASGYPDMDADWIVDKYRDGIVYGVIARVLLLPAKPYSNPTLAKWYQQNYVSERGKARTDGIKANVFGGQRWQYPQSFATVSRKGWA